jgi:hypothetical protein
MADRDFLDTLESASKVLATVLVPVILAIAGYAANGHLEAQKQALERDKLDQQMLTRAIEVVFFAKEKEQLFGNDMSLESRRLYRAHWIATYNHYSQVKLSDDFVAIVMDQNTGAATKPLVTAADKPARENDQDGDGWVSVGTFASDRYSDLNFEVPPASVAKDGTIKSDTMIRARWSVNLRKNIFNTEDREHKLNEVLGLMQAGECAKVLRSEAKIRGQTWALIDVVPCPLAMAKAPAPRG